MVLVGALLAGGRSSRMGGGHKFLREIDGVSLIDRVRRRLAPQVDFLVASVAPHSHLYDLGMVTIEDRIAEAGPLAGVHALLSWCNDVLGDAMVVTVPSDTPFIPFDLVERLEAARTGHDATLAVASSSGGVHYAIGVWPATLAPALGLWLEASGARAMKDFLREQRYAIAEFADEPDPFFNVNTPLDLVEAEARSRQEAS